MKTIARITTPFFLFLMLTIFSQNALAESGNVSLGAKASTLGVGPDLTIGILDSLNLSIAGHWGSLDFDGEGEDIDYEGDFDLVSGLIAAKWYPFGGDRDFHIAVGAVANGNNFEGSADLKITGEYTIGYNTYTYTDVGRLEAEIDYDGFAPYFGIGFGNPVRKGSNLSYFFDIGVVYQGPATVDLKTTGGTLSTDSIFLNDLKEEEDELEEDLEDFKYYPVIAFGLTYAF